MPNYIAAGKAGEIVMVMGSRKVIKISIGSASYSNILGKRDKNPIIVNDPKSRRNLIDSAKKLNLCGFGYRIDLIN